MSDINEVKIKGRIVSDLNLIEVNNSVVLNFIIVTNRLYKKTSGETVDEATFHPVVAWGVMAEEIHGQFLKHDTITVFGRHKTDNWIDKDGNKRNRLKIVVEGYEK